MIIKFFSPGRVGVYALFLGLVLSFSLMAQAAQQKAAKTQAPKTQTLSGTISLGSGRFALETKDGKVISFMGKGGNKVFAKCRNGDLCEITGTVVFNTRMPLFITVDKVKKLGHSAANKAPAKTPAVSSDTATDKTPASPANKTSASEPAQQPASQEASQEEQQAPVDSPLLPDTADKPAVHTATPQ